MLRSLVGSEMCIRDRSMCVLLVLSCSSFHGFVHVYVRVSSSVVVFVLVLVPWSRPGVVCESLRASSSHGSVHVQPCVCFFCCRARLSMASSMSMCVHLRTRPRPRTRTMVPPRCRLRVFAITLQVEARLVGDATSNMACVVCGSSGSSGGTLQKCSAMR